MTIQFKTMVLTAAAAITICILGTGCCCTGDVCCKAKNCSSPAKFELYRYYSSNMVLQAGRPIRFAGTAAAGKTITVKFAGQTVKGTASPSGEWEAVFPAMTYGGPYTVEFSDGCSGVVKLTDVLIGEVWLCSGQSNMGCTACHAHEMNNAHRYPNVRLLQIKNTFNFTGPQKTIETDGWSKASAESVFNFSAVAYHFGKDLNMALNVPVGIIQSNWGGSAITSWIPQDVFYSWGYQAETKAREKAREKALASAEQDRKDMEKYRKDFDVWVDSFYAAAKNSGKQEPEWILEGFRDSDWKSITLPNFFESECPELNDKDGIFRVRRTFTVPKELVGKKLILGIGAIDDCDETYVNGKEVGRTDHRVDAPWIAKRTYTIPAGLLHAGENTIAIRVTDLGMGTGIVGGLELRDPESETRVSLSGTWKFKVEQFVDLKKLKVRPQIKRPANHGAPSAMYNAMIAPLTGFPVRGFVWYQGEQDHRSAARYMRLLPLLITSWRAKWNEPDAPFLIVQLPGFETDGPGKGKSWDHFYDKPKDVTHGWKHGWGAIREVQEAASVTMPNVGLCVLIDQGEPDNIHPADKVPVGYRLAKEAERIAYGKKILSRGPTYRGHKIQGKEIIIRFDNTGSGLVSKDGKALRHFAIAGKDGKFVHADAVIRGNQVVVSSPLVANPKRVRYAWASYNHQVNFFNKEGFPAVPFRTDKPDYLMSNQYPAPKD